MGHEPNERTETANASDGDDMIDPTEGDDGEGTDALTSLTDDADGRNASEHRRRHAAWIALRYWV